MSDFKEVIDAITKTIIITALIVMFVFLVIYYAIKAFEDPEAFFIGAGIIIVIFSGLWTLIRSI